MTYDLYTWAKSLSLTVVCFANTSAGASVSERAAFAANPLSASGDAVASLAWAN